MVGILHYIFHQNFIFIIITHINYNHKYKIMHKQYEPTYYKKNQHILVCIGKLTECLGERWDEPEVLQMSCSGMVSFWPPDFEALAGLEDSCTKGMPQCTV